MTTDIATNCTADIFTKVRTIPEFVKDKTFSIVSEQDLVERSKLVKHPFLGVMYEGMQATSGDPSRQGLAVDIRVVVVLGMASKKIADLDTFSEAARLLGQTRKAIRMTKSPSMHAWRFSSESYFGIIGNTAIYLQRWITFAPITD